jgi:hypothetical protein
VDAHGHAGFREVRGERHDVALVRMDAARRHQAHEVRGTAALPERGGKLREPREAAIGDRLVDARQVLQHHAAGADVHVADLRVAHLALGQSHEGLARLQEGVRRGRQELVPGRGLRLADRVVLALLSIAPAIEDAENHGTRAQGGCHWLVI